VFTDDVLIPVRYLLNGRSIAQIEMDHLTYWHVELAQHDLLLAEGLPCESYLDTGNRGAFANGGGAIMARPDFALRVWSAQACAALVVGGPALLAVRGRLDARAHELGWTTTDEPAPQLFAGGQRIAPRLCGGDIATFILPPGCRDARLLSRTAVPAHGHPHSTDHRRLGLAVIALALDGVELPLHHARLGAGWYAPEPGLRWTDGDALIELAGERDLTMRFARLLRYPAALPGRDLQLKLG
jgi:hypothetical protein